MIWQLKRLPPLKMRLINKIRLRLIIYKTVKVLCKVILQVKITNFQKSVSYKNEMKVCFIVHAEDHMNESVKKTEQHLREEYEIMEITVENS